MQLSSQWMKATSGPIASPLSSGHSTTHSIKVRWSYLRTKCNSHPHQTWLMYQRLTYNINTHSIILVKLICLSIETTPRCRRLLNMMDNSKLKYRWTKQLLKHFKCKFSFLSRLDSGDAGTCFQTGLGWRLGTCFLYGDLFPDWTRVTFWDLFPNWTRVTLGDLFP